MNTIALKASSTDGAPKDRFIASQWRVEWCDYIALLVEVCCLPFLSYLIVAYVHLAYRVEAGMRELCGERFDDYAKNAMVSAPSVFCWDAFLTTSVPQGDTR